MFVLFPSAAPTDVCNRTLAAWRQRGWRSAVFRDNHCDRVAADHVIWGEYQGYNRTTDFLVQWLFDQEPLLQWACLAGDDMLPPDLPPETICRQCSAHFNGTFGVMQCTGDPMGVDSSGLRAAERICGSPLVGREFARRFNSGQGPLWPEYQHFYADEELHDITLELDLLWQRPNLTILHQHYSRMGTPQPQYMAKAQARWNDDQALFTARKAAGFPGHEAIAP